MRNPTEVLKSLTEKSKDESDVYKRQALKQVSVTAILLITATAPRLQIIQSRDIIRCTIKSITAMPEKP